MAHAGWFFLSAFGILAGCTVQSTTTKASDTSPATDAGAQATADGGAPTATRPATCLQILQCIAACAPNDDACVNNCANIAPPDAQTKVVALAQCLQQKSCQDATCAQAQCGTEFDACVSQSKPSGGTPLTGNAPAGSIPQSVVGTWTYAGWGETDSFVFRADGTASYSSATTGTTAGCSVTEAVTYDGPAVFADTSFTLYGTQVTALEFKCGVKTTAPQPNQTIVFDQTYDAATDTLHVVQQKGPNCPYDDLSNRSFYCGYHLVRQK
jgi:hypothetical protein